MDIYSHLPDGYLFRFPQSELEPDPATQIWINGRTLDISPDFLYDFFHDLRWDREGGISVAGWESEVTGGLALVSFANAESRGNSAFSRKYLSDLARMKAAVFESGPFVVERMANPDPDEMAMGLCLPSYKSRFEAAVAHVRRAAAAMDAMIQAVIDSQSLVVCWGRPDCKIKSLYERFTPSMAQVLLEMPHLDEAFFQPNLQRGLLRLANKREAEFNKWLKGIQRSKAWNIP